jgi:hypothetical protein
VDAESGDVTVKDVEFVAVQKNDVDGDLLSARNTIDVTIVGRSGNANAYARCINKAKDNDGRVSQACKQYVDAESGSVTIKDIELKLIQSNDAEADAKDAKASGDLRNSVTFTLRAISGDANAAAYCLNEAQDNDRPIDQTCNQYVNAESGDVTLSGIELVAVQTNDLDADISDANNTVDVTIVGRSGDASAIANCLNEAKDNDGRVSQTCNQYVDAESGSVTIKDIEIKVVQNNETA